MGHLKSDQEKDRNGHMQCASGQDRLDSLAVDVGQPHVAAAPAVGQALVIHAQQVEHRRVQVVDLAPALDRLVSVLVRRPMGDPALDAPAGQPDAESERIVVATVGLGKAVPLLAYLRTNGMPAFQVVPSANVTSFTRTVSCAMRRTTWGK